MKHAPLPEDGSPNKGVELSVVERWQAGMEWGQAGMEWRRAGQEAVGSWRDCTQRLTKWGRESWYGCLEWRL